MLPLNFGVAADGDCKDARDLERTGAGAVNLAENEFGKVVSIAASVLAAVRYSAVDGSVDG